MTDLADKKCIPCEGGIPSFNIEEIHKYLKKVDGWDVNSADKKDFYIVKEFKFNNFLESQSFVNKVGEIAEEEGHHPKIVTEWGSVTVYWWSHKIQKIHLNDLILAARCDVGYSSI